MMRIAKRQDQSLIPNGKVTYEDGVRPKKVEYLLGIKLEGGQMIASLSLMDFTKQFGERGYSTKIGDLPDFEDTPSVGCLPDGAIHTSLLKEMRNNLVEGFQTGLAILLSRVAELTIGLNESNRNEVEFVLNLPRGYASAIHCQRKIVAHWFEFDEE